MNKLLSHKELEEIRRDLQNRYFPSCTIVGRVEARTTIRKLMGHIEVLEEERKACADMARATVKEASDG